MVLLGQDFWKSSGWHLLDKNEEGYLNVTEDFIAAYFERPELVPIEESCSNERDLHKKLTLNPTMKVENKDLEKFKDKDSAFNYQMVLNFRDFILQQLTLETALVNISKGEEINFPPLFVSQIVHVIVRSIVDGWVDPIHLRASEILFREQSVTLDNGRIMVADRSTVQFQTQQSSLNTEKKLKKYITTYYLPLAASTKTQLYLNLSKLKEVNLLDLSERKISKSNTLNGAQRASFNGYKDETLFLFSCRISCIGAYNSVGNFLFFWSRLENKSQIDFNAMSHPESSMAWALSLSTSAHLVKQVQRMS